MNEINRKIKVPFQKISYKSVFSKQSEMNELESLIVALIATSNDEGLKRETLFEALNKYFAITEHTIPLIKIALRSLVNSRTIIIDRSAGESLKTLLDKRIRSIKIGMNEDIIEKVRKGIFVKNTLNTRTFHESIFTSLIAGTSPKKSSEYEYDGNWKIKKIGESVINQEALDDSNKNQQNNESLTSFNVDEDDTKVVYLQDEITFKKLENKEIVPVNKLAQVVFDEISNKNISTSLLEEMLDLSLDDLPFEDKDGVEIDKSKSDIIQIANTKIVIVNGVIMKLFNKEVHYQIANTKIKLNVNELYGDEIKQIDLINEIVSLGLVEKLESFKEFETEFSKVFLSMEPSEKNSEFILYYLEKKTLLEKITTFSALTIKLFSEEEIRREFKSSKSTFIEFNIESINQFILKTKVNYLYSTLYNITQKHYNKETILFPGWDKEQEHSRFIKDNSKLESEYSLIDKKSDAENFIEKLLMYNFNPIISTVYNDFLNSAKKKVSSLPISNSEVVRTYGSKIRMMLETLVSKDFNVKNTFSDQLNIEIKAKKIESVSKKSILDIYKRSNQFHHEADIQITKTVENSIKKDIVAILDIANKNNIKLTKFKEEATWATA